MWINKGKGILQILDSQASWDFWVISNFHCFSVDRLLRSSRFHRDLSECDVIPLSLWYRLLVFKINLKQQCQSSIFFIFIKSYLKKKQPVKHRIDLQREWEEDVLRSDHRCHIFLGKDGSDGRAFFQTLKWNWIKTTFLKKTREKSVSKPSKILYEVIFKSFPS